MRSWVRVLGLALWVAWPLTALAELPVESQEAVTAEAMDGLAPEIQADAQALEVTFTSQGQASFYAKRFHGRRTASGESHDASALTAAHRSLPFGTWVQVQSLYSGRSVSVRINDRGPFARGRIIDLSRAAADVLGMLRTGTHEVKVQVLGLPSVQSTDP